MSVQNYAGTVVTAVLETAGYTTQSHILDHFGSFFISGGAILYLIALLGATISAGAFGTFRAARYLLVGPGLLYFCVFTTAEVEPVTWKLGGPWKISDKLAVDYSASWEPFSLSMSEGLSVKTMFVGPLKLYWTEDEEIRVAWFFRWFTHLISETTNSITDVILTNEFEQDLLFLTRDQLLRLIVTSTVDDERMQSVVKDSLLGECQPVTNTMIALSDPKFGTDFMLRVAKRSMNSGNIMSMISSIGTILSLFGERQYLLDTLVKQKDFVVNPGQATRSFIRDRILAKIGGDTTDILGFTGLTSNSVDYATALLPPTSDEKELIKRIDEGQVSMTCENTWLTARDALRVNARIKQEQYFYAIFHYMKPHYLPVEPLARVVLCRSLAKKLHGGTAFENIIRQTTGLAPDDLFENGCSLVDTIALHMMRNMLISEASHAEAAENNANTPELSSFGTGARPVDSQSYGQGALNNGVIQGGNSGTLSPQTSALPSAQNSFASQAATQMPYSMQQQATGQTQCPAGTYCSEVATLVFNRNSIIRQQRDEAFSNQVSQMARDMMQEMFIYAMQLPYWQGVMLYLLALAYPFFAVILVLPNRASAFMYLPLAWLWIKSWDIGFALVRIFDQVLWEILPAKSLPFTELLDNAWEMVDATINDLDPDFYIPSILRKVLYEDVMAELYQHYFFLSIAFFAVPSVMGLIIMKGREYTLATFSGAAAAFAQQTSSDVNQVRADMAAQVSGGSASGSSASGGSTSSAATQPSQPHSGGTHMRSSALNPLDPYNEYHGYDGTSYREKEKEEEAKKEEESEQHDPSSRWVFSPTVGTTPPTKDTKGDKDNAPSSPHTQAPSTPSAPKSVQKQDKPTADPQSKGTSEPKQTKPSSSPSGHNDKS